MPPMFRPFLALLLFLSLLLPLRAEEPPELSAFAEAYWAAIQTGDAEKIYALYDPAVFTSISAPEADFLKTYWMKGYAANALNSGDFHEIRTKKLLGNDTPFPDWRWASKPEYQIEIETFRRVADGSEGLTMIADLVISKEGRFYIIRPVPPEAILKKAMQPKP